MELIKSTHCRNGVTATPYDMGVVRDKGADYLVIQFDIDHTAAIEITEAGLNMLNHLRGDYFSDTFKSLLEKERKTVEHTEACIEYNQKYEHDTPGECICHD